MKLSNIINKIKRKFLQMSSASKFNTRDVFSNSADINDIYYCFRLILGRNPNSEERKGHLGLVGVDLTEVVKTYIQSVEFQKRNLLKPSASEIAIIEKSNFKVCLDLKDHAVGREVANGEYEPHVTKIFRTYLKPGMRVLDIGANIGYFSLLSSSLVGESGVVFAIEPNMNNCRFIQASKNLNNFTNISIMQFAAHSSTGILSINSSFSNGTTTCPSANLDILMTSNSVAAIQLDNIKEFDKGIDLIKVDVEGAEYNALLGAKKLISKFRPIIVTEFSPAAMPYISGVDGLTYLNFICSFGYDLSILNADRSIHEYGQDTEGVIKAYNSLNVDHIDILAVPKLN